MGFLNTVRAGIALANKLTADLQCTVMVSSVTSISGSGTKVYGAAVPRQALVDWKQKQVRTATGILTVSRAEVTFLDPTVVIDDTDKIVLPDGTTGPILDMSGFIDRETGNPVLTQVWLG